MLFAHPRLMPLNLVLRDIAVGASLLTRKLLMIVGFLAVLAAGAVVLDADIRGQLGQAWSGKLQPALWRLAGVQPAQAVHPEPAPAVAPPTEQDVLEAGSRTAKVDKKEHLNLAKYLAKRYRVSTSATDMLVGAAFVTGKETGVDPVLILAVMAIESGLNPFAESGMGAQGLMQVMSRVHIEKFEDFGGLDAAFHPLANIKVGALILKDCIRRGGSLEAGLRLYVGAASGDDGGYGAKVLAERTRLLKAMIGKFDFAPSPKPAAPSVVPAIPAVPAPQTVEQPAAPDTDAKDHLAAA
jgi:soluble lytic murein transglycosylase-like protein